MLLHAMGKALFGLYLSFQGIAALGGLGDLGMGGAVALSVGQLLAKGDEPEIQRFLAAARALFGMLAVGIGLVFLLGSPWFPLVFGFKSVPGSGSLTALFAVCAPSMALLVVGSYWANLNYAVQNLTWPILPSLVLGQIALSSHWLLAKSGMPLWLQYLPYPATAFAGICLSWIFLRISHPSLAHIFSVRLDGPQIKTLLGRSGWVYLIALGYQIYTVSDRLLINAAFGPDFVPAYQLNYKVCELALLSIVTATYVSLPKLTLWLASPDSALRERAKAEAAQLNRFICFLGSVAAVVYLGINDHFISLWLGSGFHVPVAWQAAFAANLAITAGASVSLELSIRAGGGGLRVGGLSVAFAAVLNLVLSIAAIWIWHSPLGVAVATVIAALVQATTTAVYSTRKLNMSTYRWLLPSVAWPHAALACAIVLRSCRLDGIAGDLVYAIGAVIIIIALAALYGITVQAVRHEWRMLLGKGR